MATEGILETCSGCAARLPLRPTFPGEFAIDWECTICGAHYCAVLRENAPSEELRNVRKCNAPSQASFITADVLQPRGRGRTALPGVYGVRSRIETDLSRHLDMAIEEGGVLELGDQSEPFAVQLPQLGRTAYDQATLNSHYQSHRANATRVDGLFNGLAQGRRVRVADAESLTREMLDQFREDPDLQVRLSLNATDGGYPSSQGLRSAMLAVAIGAAMGYDAPALTSLGSGCIVHDLGMQAIRSDLKFDSKRVFTANDYAKVASHPVHTFDLLRPDLDAISTEARMVAYQMHERCDGRGYPRGREAEQIHPLAKIAAVADAFVALVSPRPHRDGLLPYFAVEKLVHDARDGLFDANVVRGLLRSVSLFPIGSTISIGDELVGRVLRTNPNQYDRPIVEIRSRRNLQADPVVVDLAKFKDLPIRPIATVNEEAAVTT